MNKCVIKHRHYSSWIMEVNGFKIRRTKKREYAKVFIDEKEAQRILLGLTDSSVWVIVKA
jgi:hypothetical protein